tara:strand:- start:480 stop:1190 length:711 start_codon:yes stop_codon:yes gene_type:complete
MALQYSDRTSIDSVYQKVLVLANKEQRGYITPQEFNLFADRAQNEKFDSYFHDLKTTYHKPKTNMHHGDEMELLEEKMEYFETVFSSTLGEYFNVIGLPTNLYMIQSVTRPEGIVTPISQSELNYTESHPLLKSTINRSVYVKKGTSIRIYPVPTVESTFTIRYYTKPAKPEWAYVVVKDRALYNSNATTNFALHKSEEEWLVSRILQLAGVTIMKQEVVQIGAADQAGIKANQND